MYLSGDAPKTVKRTLVKDLQVAQINRTRLENGYPPLTVKEVAALSDYNWLNVLADHAGKALAAALVGAGTYFIFGRRR